MNKKLKKVLAVFMSVLMMFSATIPAFALSMGDKCSFNTKYLDAYYKTGRWETANGKVHDDHGQVALRNIKSTGEPLYCLQVYEATQGSNATAGNIEDTDVWKNELTRTARNGITRVSIWGYPNFTYGYSKNDVQLATQVLIWEFETGARTNYSQGCKSWAKSIFKNYKNALKCYNEILEACNKHTIRPDFGTTTVELKGVGKNNAVTLIDKNGVLNLFTVTCNNPNVVVSKSGNKLTIYAKKSGNLTAKLIFTKDKTNINSALALKGANQTMLYGSLADPVFKDLNVELSLGSIKIAKYSEDKVYGGFNFKITGHGIDKTITTNKDGYAYLNDLEAGNYTVTEILSDSQNRYVQPQSQTITIKAGETTTVNFHNELKRANAILHKVDSETGKNIETKDGIFEVLEWSNNKNQYIPFNTMQWSNHDRAYIIENLPVTLDNDGKYKVIEKQAPTGYVTPSELNYEFQITEDGQVFDINNGSVQNDVQKGRIHITKEGEVLDYFDFMQTDLGMKYSPVYKVQGLANTKWEISAIDDIVVNGDVKYKAGDVIETLTTKKDGATSKPLYLGKYLVKEIETADGYFIGSNEFEVELKYHGADVDVFTENVSSVNERQHFKMQFEKTMEENTMYPNPDAYKDVVFGVYAAEDIKNTDGEVVLDKDSMVDCLTINELYQGNSTIDFPVNTKWYLKEIKTAEGYVLNENKYEFETKSGDQNIPMIFIDLNEDGTVIENKTIKGTVEFKKVDKDNNNFELTATYGLYRASDDMLIEERTSEPHKWTQFSELPYGEYYLKEIKAPDGYEQNDEKYSFAITEDKQNVQITAGNIKTPIVVETHSPDTGNNIVVPIVFGLLGVAAVIGGGLALHKKKKNDENADSDKSEKSKDNTNE